MSNEEKPDIDETTEDDSYHPSSSEIASVTPQNEATDVESPEDELEAQDADESLDVDTSEEPENDVEEDVESSEDEEEEDSSASRWSVAQDGTPPEADPETLAKMLNFGQEMASETSDLVESRTVHILEDIDEEEFFRTKEDTQSSIVTRYDLEKAVPMEKKSHFREIQRYWINEPYAFISIFKSVKENEVKYYAIEPHLNSLEEEAVEFFSKKLRTAIKYGEEDIAIDGTDEERGDVIEKKTHELFKQFKLYEPDSYYAKKQKSEESVTSKLKKMLSSEEEEEEEEEERPKELDGMAVRPEHALIEENRDKLSSYQVEKILYYLRRNFVGYERIDPIKNDINVEDISCDGYNSPVFVYHGEYEQIISNIVHGKKQLDDFVVKLAQRSGKAISKRMPQVDCTLPDGSRAQLTLGAEVSDHGTNYTIRQFKDVPFTPLDLICWKTFGLDTMAFLWLCIENHKSLIFAGGTASGKTTSLNAVSLFIPSKSKIVSIEDTREVELPQRNWIASVTRPSFEGDDKGNVDEFALLEAALRQRPEYIVMGEIRGEEGRTLFQVMSTGHTTYTTFHADSVGEVLKRFTTAPINVSKTLFTALDLVSIQTSTRVNGRKVRRNKELTEINHYDAENDEINVKDVFTWIADGDYYLAQGTDETVLGTSTIEGIMFDRGYSEDEVWDELLKRQLILAYLLKHDLRTYTQVAATLQAFMNDEETVLTLIANGDLERSLEALREMESVLIDIDADKEALVPRPSCPDDIMEWCEETLEKGHYLLEPYIGKTTGLDIGDALETSDIAGTEIVVENPQLEDGSDDEVPELEAGDVPEDTDDTPELEDDSGDGDNTDDWSDGIASGDDEE